MPDQTPETLDNQTASQSAATPETTAADGASLPDLTLGSAPAAEETRERAAPAMLRGKLDRLGNALGTGRRKTAVARVRMRPGTGQMSINGRPLEDYFRIERDRLLVEAPLRTAGRLGQVDVSVKVEGGGITGQTGAIVLAIARALEALEPELHYTLADAGYLTRDGRMVERKKYGFKKARRSFQFSKR